MTTAPGPALASPPAGGPPAATRLTRDQLRTALAEEALNAARPVPLVLAGLFALFLVFNAVAFPEQTRLPLLVHDLALTGLFLALWWAIRRHWLPARHYHLAVGGSVLAVASNILLAEHLSADPLYTAYILVTVIAASNFVLSARLLWLTLTPTLGVWLLVTAPLVSAEELIHLGFAQLAALTVAVVTQVSRLRATERLLEARHRDATQQRELEAALAAAAKEMAERTRLAAQLQQAQKMEAIGNLAGGLAHEMNNVLTVVLALASAWRDDPALAQALRTDLEEISGAARRGQSLTRNLLQFARRSHPRRESIAVGELVAQTAQLLRRTLDRRINLTHEVAADTACVRGDAHQLQQVLMNLCLNSAQAIDGAGEIAILVDNLSLSPEGAAPVRLPPGDWVRLRVRDDGRGMEADVLAHALEPFFTTRPPGQGSGLGLAVVFGLVTDHGGSVQLDSVPGRGTTVTVLLPRADPAASAVPAPPRSPAPIGVLAPGTVLIIDDEAPIRSTVERLLKLAGLTVLSAENGEQGVTLYAEHRPDVVLLDMSMPGIDGAECARRLRELDPAAVICLSSGYVDSERLREAVAHGAQAVLPKPFEADELLGVVQRLLATRERRG